MKKKASDVIDQGVVFTNSFFKLLLNLNPIIDIADKFSKKSFENWEEKPCRFCTEDRLCKKHAALERIKNTERAVLINGITKDDNLKGLFLSKSDMFVINEANESLLIIDCPPFSSKSVVINDSWVRKFSPFSLPFTDPYEFDIVQSLDIGNLTRNSYTGYFGTVDGKKATISVARTLCMEYTWKLDIKE